MKQITKATLITLALTAGFPVWADTSEEAVTWLQKMATALRTEDYQGIFSYMRGSTYDTVKIVHSNRKGREVERLYKLNGEELEVLREDEEVLCYHPRSDEDSPDTLSHHPVQIGPFSAAFIEKVLSSQTLYRLAMHGDDRIVGRSAVTVFVSPRNDDRYGYRLWLDRDTGLLLQSHLVERGKVKEIFQFTDLQIGTRIPDEGFDTAIRGETVSHRLTLDRQERSEKPVWRVAWLPEGFRAVSVQGNRLHFSDGLATFSVFVEKSSTASLPESTRVGGTVVITRRLKKSGPQITVVGDVPVRTARRVAESVEPVLY